MLSHLFETGGIDLRRGALFDVAPGPMPASLDWGRVEGMMLGLAIGDALGATSEGLLPGRRRARYGEIRDYLPHPYLDSRAAGLPTDDTQLAFWTLEQMIADRGFHPERVAARFCSERIYGVGSTVRQFVANCRAGLPWYRCGPKSSGNGALMRIAPMLIPHLASGTPDLWADTALSAMITHNDSASISACLSFVHMLWQLLRMEAPPAPGWWPQAYVELARELEVDETYRPRGGSFAAYQGMLWRFVEERVPEAFAAGQATLDACDAWGSGAYLLETVPSVLYILMRHGGDFEEAIVRAVNDTVDNDTVAAIVGAAVGALHGVEAIPERWRSGLLGRVKLDGADGRITMLLAQGRALWWPPATLSRPLDPKRIVREGYDRIAESYLNWVEGERSAVRTRYTQWLLDALPAGAEVLDLGCGAGGPTTQALAARFSLTGVDLSPHSIALARENVPGARFLQADIAALDLPEASLDGVAAFYSLIHVPRTEQRNLLTRIAGWLRPGGLFVATMGTRGTPGDVDDDFLGTRMYWSTYDGETNRRLIEEAGLQVVHAQEEAEEEHGERVAFLWIVARKPGPTVPQGAPRPGACPPAPSEE